jgi:methionine sulfoxide reductase heme-binding subunit
VDGMMQWDIMRGTGTALMAMLTLSTAMGVMATARFGSPLWPRFATQTLHRNISLLTMAMLVAHIGIAVYDEAVDIRWYDAFLPLPSAYHGYWLWLGTLATDIMLTVVITSLLRHRLSHRIWRVLHLSAYVSWAFGLLHGIGIGTDATTPWEMSVTIVSVGVVAAVTVVRLATLVQERKIAA